MSERITTERAREIAGRDHGAHCRHCADSIALAADLLDARASLAAERTRREAAEARLAAIVGAVRELRAARDHSVVAMQDADNDGASPDVQRQSFIDSSRAEARLRAARTALDAALGAL